MTKALDLKIAQNKDEEAKLTAAFEQADKGYSEALESYDTDLMTQNTELNNLQKEYEEKQYELNQLKSEWE